jgi:quercetin dioxygenase-like cupin family protein
MTVIKWEDIEPTRHPGERSHALWRTWQAGDVRVRRVSYARGYLADHWCDRGHVVHVLSGELITELKDGRAIVTPAGQTYCVGNLQDPHRSRVEVDTELLIVD